MTIKNYTALQVQTDATQISNDLIAGNAVLPAQITETFTANGTDIYWPLRYVPDTAFVAPVLVVGGVPRTVGSAGSGSVSSAYGLLTLASDIVALCTGTDGVPPSGTVLTLSYVYDAPVLVELVDNTSIAGASALPSLGHLQHQPVNAGATLAAAVAGVQGQLSVWASAITRAQLTLSQETDPTGIEEDQQISLVSNRLGIT